MCEPRAIGRCFVLLMNLANVDDVYSAVLIRRQQCSYADPAISLGVLRVKIVLRTGGGAGGVIAVMRIIGEN